MYINVAIGSLACEPPGWLRRGITDDMSIIESAAKPRRRRELLWSRGLKASLVARIPGRLASARPIRVSIAHDRYFTAVATSQCNDIGIDLQTDYPLQSCHQIAETWFPDLESKEILEAENCDRFLLSWVIKEAWAKCMNRTIFESCQGIAVWQGQVHIAGVAAEVPPLQFAWSRQHFGDNKRLGDELHLSGPGVTNPGACEVGFAMGICLKGKTPDTPNIECLIPGSNSKLRHFSAHWAYIPVAA